MTDLVIIAEHPNYSIGALVQFDAKTAEKLIKEKVAEKYVPPTVAKAKA